MAGGSQFIWIPLLLLCVLQTFENAHVHYTSTRPEVDSEVGNTLSKMPITLPNGYIPKNVNVTSISIKTCTVLELLSVHTKIAAIQRLISVHIEKSKTNAADYQRQWRQKADLLKKKILELNRDENNKELTKEILILQALLVLLQAKEKEFAIAQAEISVSSESFDDMTSCSVTELKRKLKIMTEKYSGVEEIYDQAKIEFEQNIAELNRTGGHTPALKDPDRISELKRKLEKTQEELNSKNADIQRMIANPQIFLTIIGLQNKIWDLQKNATNGTINKTVKELQARLDGLISEIDNNGDDNTKLMLKIITVQSQVEQLQRQLSELHILQSSQVIEFRNDLTTKQTELQKYIDELNEKNQTNSRLILKVTQLHSQLRNLEEERHMDNETSSLTISQLRKELRSRMVERTRDQAEMKVLKALLQANERKHAISQAKVLELQKKLQLKSEECSGLAGRYEQINTEFEQRIAELNRTGDSKAALVLKVMNLHDELMNRRDLILTTKDPEMKSILTIIELQNEIRDLQKTDTDGTKRNRVEELYNRVHGFISEIDDGDNETLKLTLKILTLQSQIEQLKKHFSNDKLVNATQVTELKNDLASKKNELQKYINDLDRENKTNANLILTITSLKNQLRNLQLENQDENEAVSATITKLREQLRTKEEEHFQDQAEIKGLQNELDDKMHELLSKTDTVTSLELQKVIYEKNNELANKTEELKARSSQAQRLLQIITLQTQIEKLSIEAINDTDYEKIVVLQGYMSDLIGGIQDENDENTKLMFQILAQQDEIARLKKQEETQTNAQLKKIGAAQIMELHWKIQPLEDEISYLEQTNAENVAELQTKLSLTKRQLQDSELRLKDLDTKNFNSNLKQEVENLKTCCIETNDCGDVHRQLQQSQEDADRLQQQLQDKDTHLNQMQEELVEQARVTETLQSDYSNLERQFQQSQDMVDNLQKQLLEKDASLNQLKQELEERTTENNKLEEDYNNLQNEKNKLEESLQDLQNKLSDVEDPTIHTRKIVFDPNTAHPRIALSADNTEMSTRVEAQNVPDYPGRFDVDLAVLGTTGYSSGRQYWEVSVVGKRCYHLGMTSESAQRKGSISYSPANGYWTIILNKQGQFKAADRRAVTIQVQVQPLSLGILLDYKRGQISFYDAGSRSLLYSFVGQTFTDKIYPFVNFCVEDVANPTPIVLLTPDSVDWIK
ncbi:Zinc-binding protein A33 [Channa argus]|uniref:Zinc-binding protein A33 n=1 Tax=Channa argus TaxID=215402 RepID=A0A6G1Q9G0_CHAAH|nr:Zinc-binding protein A33 [Channa argus]